MPRNNGTIILKANFFFKRKRSFCGVERGHHRKNYFKGNAQFVQKELNLWWICNKTLMKVGNITKAATFKSFFHLSYKNTQLLFFVTVLLNIFMRQTWTNDFLGLHKNMNCTFPLSCWTKTVIKKDVFTYRSICWKWKLLTN